MAASGGAHVRFARKEIGPRGEREARRLHERWLERERAVAAEHERRSAESPRFKELRRRGAERSAAAMDEVGDDYGLAAHELAAPLFVGANGNIDEVVDDDKAEEEEEEEEEDDEEEEEEEEEEEDDDDDPPPPPVVGDAPVEGGEGLETDDYRTDFESSGDIDIG